MDIGRGGSTGLETTDGETAAETGDAMAGRGMVTGLRDAEGDRGLAPEAESVSTSALTDAGLARARENTGGIVREARSAGVRTTATEDLEITSVMVEEAQGATRGVATAARVAVGHPTVTPGLTEEGTTGTTETRQSTMPLQQIHFHASRERHSAPYVAVPR